MTLAPAMRLLRLLNKRHPLYRNTPALNSISFSLDPTGLVGSERMEVGQRLGGYYEDLRVTLLACCDRFGHCLESYILNLSPKFILFVHPFVSFSLFTCFM